MKLHKGDFTILPLELNKQEGEFDPMEIYFPLGKCINQNDFACAILYCKKMQTQEIMKCIKGLKINVGLLIDLLKACPNFSSIILQNALRLHEIVTILKFNPKFLKEMKDNILNSNFTVWELIEILKLKEEDWLIEEILRVPDESITTELLNIVKNKEKVQKYLKKNGEINPNPTQ